MHMFASIYIFSLLAALQLNICILQLLGCFFSLVKTIFMLVNLQGAGAVLIFGIVAIAVAG